MNIRKAALGALAAGAVALVPATVAVAGPAAAAASNSAAVTTYTVANGTTTGLITAKSTVPGTPLGTANLTMTSADVTGSISNASGSFNGTLTVTAVVTGSIGSISIPAKTVTDTVTVSNATVSATQLQGTLTVGAISVTDNLGFLGTETVSLNNFETPTETLGGANYTFSTATGGITQAVPYQASGDFSMTGNASVVVSVNALQLAS